MSSHEKQHAPVSRFRMLVRQFLSTVSILCIVLYAIFFVVDVHEYLKKKDEQKKAGGPMDSFAASMRNSIQDQLTRLQQVDPMGLVGVYDDTLDAKECNWIFWCHDKPKVASPIDPAVKSLTGRYAAQPSLESMDALQQSLARQSRPATGTAPAGNSTPLSIPDESAPGSLRSESDAAISARLSAHPLPRNSMSLDGGPVVLFKQNPGLAASTDKTATQPLAHFNSLPSNSALSTASPSTTTMPVPNSHPPPMIHSPLQSGQLIHIGAAEKTLSNPSPLPFMSHFIFLGPIPIPKWDTIRGTPYALLQMAVAIRKQGARAVAMYISCTVIFIALWLWAASKAKEGGYWIYATAVFAPLTISLMVWCVQLIAEGALKTFGWALGMLAIIVAHATAIALLVGVRHIVKTPWELAEQLEKFH